tara:strand:- start:6028 stop:6258 length:231 start_codon:yes stop_codon:yes gene_type:complete
MIPMKEIATIAKWSQDIKLIEVNNWGYHKYTKIIFNDGTIKITNRYADKEDETYIHPSDLSLNEIANLYYESQNGR